MRDSSEIFLDVFDDSFDSKTLLPLLLHISTRVSPGGGATYIITNVTYTVKAWNPGGQKSA